MTPFTCTGSEEVCPIEIFDQDGKYCTCIMSSACMAAWLCLNYKEFGMYPGCDSLTWRYRFDAEIPEDADPENLPVPGEGQQPTGRDPEKDDPSPPDEGESAESVDEPETTDA